MGVFPPLSALSEEEEMIRESAAQFAKSVLAPRVHAMDQNGSLDVEIVSALFEQGFMGIETPEEFGGVGLGFTAACLAVEEVAKVDPAVAVLMDIQNTLLITAFKTYGTETQKQDYLPRLSSDT